jgi:hypothetical protein
MGIVPLDKGETLADERKERIEKIAITFKQ